MAKVVLSRIGKKASYDGLSLAVEASGGHWRETGLGVPKGAVGFAPIFLDTGDAPFMGQGLFVFAAG